MVRKGSGEYPKGWPEFAAKLKEAAGWQCSRCGHPHEPKTGYTLTVHHLTMNKAEPFDHWWVFVVLCQRCHLSIQSRVVLERAWYLPHSAWFKPHAAGWYAYMNGIETDKEYVMEHMDELLMIGQVTRAEANIP
jgi:hypothetical protein